MFPILFTIGLLKCIYLSLFQHDPEQWRVVFFIAAGFYLVGNSLYVIFGKANVQPWNDPPAKPRRNSTPQVESQH